MKSTRILCGFVLWCMCMLTSSYADIQVLDPGYKAELWLSLSASTGSTRDLVFDPEGNLYFSTPWMQSITKITPDKQVNTSWVTGLSRPLGLEYTGGTSYGNNFYVACLDSSSVVKVDMNGNKSTFCTLSGVGSIEYDRTGQYGSKLYAATSAYDRIYSLSTTGSTQVFCSDFYDLSGSLNGIGFANSAEYNYGMYMGTWYPNNANKSGVFTITTNGVSQRICNNLTDLVIGYSIQYDNIGLFGNDLFAGIKENNEANGGIYRISPDGIASLFIEGNAGSMVFTFADDGTMYLHDWTAQAANIYKITPIPEPTTLFLLGLGLLGLRQRKG